MTFDLLNMYSAFFMHCIVFKNVFEVTGYSGIAIIHVLYTCKQCGILVLPMSIHLLFICYAKGVYYQCPQVY